jgi:hypothetical protein
VAAQQHHNGPEGPTETKTGWAATLRDLQQRGYCTDEWSRWQQGQCGTYAIALMRLKPQLRFGTLGSTRTGDGDASSGWTPEHHFAHDDTYAYDSAGQHPLPYHGVHGDADYYELDGAPGDWDRLSEEGSGEPDIADAQEHARRNRILDGDYGPQSAAHRGPPARIAGSATGMDQHLTENWGVFANELRILAAGGPGSDWWALFKSQQPGDRLTYLAETPSGGHVHVGCGSRDDAKALLATATAHGVNPKHVKAATLSACRTAALSIYNQPAPLDAPAVALITALRAAPEGHVLWVKEGDVRWLARRAPINVLQRAGDLLGIPDPDSCNQFGLAEEVTRAARAPAVAATVTEARADRFPRHQPPGPGPGSGAGFPPARPGPGTGPACPARRPTRHVPRAARGR